MMTNEEKKKLLGLAEEAIRTRPSVESVGNSTAEALAWIGRASTAIERWDVLRVGSVQMAISELQRDNLVSIRSGLFTLTALLHQVRSDLSFDLDQLSVLVQQGGVFAYFEEIRKVVQTANTEVFFVDPYLDADFVPRFLPNVKDGVRIRLLGREKMSTLLPSLDLFCKEHSRAVEVRSALGLHDRFLFIDELTCHLSGASFKDGARNAPAVITQITDAFPAMWNTYQSLWDAAKIER